MFSSSRFQHLRLVPNGVRVCEVVWLVAELQLDLTDVYSHVQDVELLYGAGSSQLQIATQLVRQTINEVQRPFGSLVVL